MCIANYNLCTASGLPATHKVPVLANSSVQTSDVMVDAASPAHGASSSSLYEALLAVPNTRLSSSVSKPEVSSVVIQTEETLQTYDQLGEVIQEWAQEVFVSGQRADAAEKQ